AVLEQNNHEALIVDALAGYNPPTEPVQGLFRCGMSEAELVAATLRLQPDLVGLTCAYTVQYPTTRSLAQAIKRATDIPIVIGGAHCSALPKETLADGCFDYVVIGEGERPLLAICAHLEGRGSIREIKGIAYRDKTGSAYESDKEP